MNDIAVGIVFHAEETAHPLRKASVATGLEVLSHVNASRRDGTPWRGFGANHNGLMTRTNARWYVALNPDVQIDAPGIVRLVGAAEQAGLALAGPAIASPWGISSSGKRGFPGPRVWLREAAAGAGRAERAARGYDGVEVSDWLTGACLAIRRDLGLRFDESYFMYFEDTDVCRRAWALGLRVGVCAGVVATHTSGWSISDPLVDRRGVEFARSALRFAERSGASTRAMTMAGMVRFGSRLAMPHARPAQRAAARSITRAFINPSLPGLSELADEFNAAESEFELQEAPRAFH